MIITRTAAIPEPTPRPPSPVEVSSTEPTGVPQPGPDVIDPGIGIPTGPSPIPPSPGTPGSPAAPGIA